jgi:hypothetical protein
MYGRTNLPKELALDDEGTNFRCLKQGNWVGNHRFALPT